MIPLASASHMKAVTQRRTEGKHMLIELPSMASCQHSVKGKALSLVCGSMLLEWPCCHKLALGRANPDEARD